MTSDNHDKILSLTGDLNQLAAKTLAFMLGKLNVPCSVDVLNDGSKVRIHAMDGDAVLFSITIGDGKIYAHSVSQIWQGYGNAIVDIINFDILNSEIKEPSTPPDLTERQHRLDELLTSISNVVDAFQEMGETIENMTDALYNYRAF